jgi:hypothetical protein
MNEPTPGPYVIGLPGGPAGPFWSLMNRDGNLVAMQITSEANARLLGAAPDLLAALEAVYETAVNGERVAWAETSGLGELVTNALAKAWGTEP